MNHSLLESRAVQAMDLITVEAQNILNMRDEEEQSRLSLPGIVTEYKDMFQGNGHRERKLKLEIEHQQRPMRQSSISSGGDTEEGTGNPTKRHCYTH